MKCPRRKFTDIDYSGDIDAQKKEICKACDEYNEQEWGRHCDASIKCMITGETLPQEAFEHIPKEARRNVTHSLSDEGRKEFHRRIDELKKKRGRNLW